MWARILGLLFCIGLLFLVAGQLQQKLGILALELLGLCAVHTLILALLMVKHHPTPSLAQSDLDDDGRATPGEAGPHMA